MKNLLLLIALCSVSSCGFKTPSSKLRPSEWPQIRYKSKIKAHTFECKGLAIPSRNIVTDFFKSSEESDFQARKTCAEEAERNCGEYASMYARLCKTQGNIVETLVSNFDDSKSPKNEYTCETRVKTSNGVTFTTLKNARSKVDCSSACDQDVRYANSQKFKDSFHDYRFPWTLESSCRDFKGTIIDISTSSVRW